MRKLTREQVIAEFGADLVDALDTKTIYTQTPLDDNNTEFVVKTRTANNKLLKAHFLRANDVLERDGLASLNSVDYYTVDNQ